MNGFGEIWGTPSILSGAGPGRLWARSVQKQERESEPNFFFRVVSKTQFHLLLVSQISRNSHTMWIYVAMNPFGKHFWKFARKGSFFQKGNFCVRILTRLLTSGRNFSEMITNRGKSWQVGMPIRMLAFHLYCWNQLKVTPLACRVCTRSVLSNSRSSMI